MVVVVVLTDRGGDGDGDDDEEAFVEAFVQNLAQSRVSSRHQTHTLIYRPYLTASSSSLFH